MTRTARIATALAVPILALAACSSGSGDGSSDSAASPASDAGRAGSLNSSVGGDEAARPAAGVAADGGGKAQAEPVEKPSIVSTGSVSLSTRDVAATRAAVQHVADTYAGQVTDEETATSDDKRLGYARMVLRVPAGSFTRAVADLEQVADLVDSSTTSEDVSTRVIDTDERVKAARASLDRIRTLLSRAERIGDVMAIESQLASREADLNSLLRQQAHLADQTTLATISVSIDRASTAPAHRAAGASGFRAGLDSGWRALRGFATGAATVLGALVPWTPVILLAGVPLWLVRRRARRAPVPATATPGEG